MTRARRNAGFSLLEVLGAIAILGIWFAIISEIAMLGLRNEGRSHRAMLASLVADEVLAEMEIGMLTGQFPEISTDEEQRDGYTVVTNVEPYDLQLPEPTNTPLNRRSGEGSAATGGKPGSPFKRLGGSSPNADSPLLRVKIEVVWFEGNGEDSVTRETFVVDLSQAQQALSELASQAKANGVAGGGSSSGADGGSDGDQGGGLADDLQ
jgi:prepilin-type N-terminal cleavage/methylation domain-containing protein